MNIAERVQGVQIGALSIARESYFSLGVLNLVGNGYHRLEVWASDLAPLNLGAKLLRRRSRFGP